MLQADKVVLTKGDKKDFKEKKRAGLLGPAQQHSPHPDGYVRGGFPRHGIRYYHSQSMGVCGEE